MDVAAEILSAILNAFEANKRLADRAVEQVPDDKLHVALDDNTNSIAVIVKHVAGNLASRWTDFLTTDGEKSWRNRDDEFVDSFGSRAELLQAWERGWACLLTALRGLKAEDLARTVRRGGRVPPRLHVVGDERGSTLAREPLSLLGAGEAGGCPPARKPLAFPVAVKLPE